MIDFLRRLFFHTSQYHREERHSLKHGIVVALIERDADFALPNRLVAPKR